MKLQNSTYDILKKVCLVFMPALATLILALGQIWHWQMTDQVAGTITALDAFLGAILGVSSKLYWEEEAHEEK